MNYPAIILAIGALIIGGYFVYRSTSQTSSACSGDWTDYFNPACIVGSASAQFTNELNTVLIILGLVVVLVIGLLAFGPQTGHIAKGASAFAL
jgi:hypothetical protein